MMRTSAMLDPVALARLHKIGGNKLLGELRELFLVHGRQRVDSAVAAEQKGDLEAVAAAVHSLKSSAGNLGGRDLYELAHQIEELAEAGDAAAVAPLVAGLPARFEQVCRDLEELRHKGPFT